MIHEWNKEFLSPPPERVIIFTRFRLIKSAVKRAITFNYEFSFDQVIQCAQNI